MHAQPRLAWWQWLGGCIVEAFVLETLRRRRGETRYTRWPH